MGVVSFVTGDFGTLGARTVATKSGLFLPVYGIPNGTSSNVDEQAGRAIIVVPIARAATNYAGGVITINLSLGNG